MKLSKVFYTGGLRCRATHLASGTEIITDAPVDNHGQGAAFSPTDTTATSLATCILTTLAIWAESREIKINEMQAEVEKVMASNPRRITGIRVDITMGFLPDSPEYRVKIMDIAQHCPVALSLHPDLKQDIKINFQ